LQPEVSHYEIMPWPDRVFNSRHPARSIPEQRTIKELEQTPTGTGLGGFGRGNPGAERVSIPKSYETELQTVITALGDMKQSAVRWESAGTLNTGVLISDTMMCQRADPNPSDANLGSFYGLAMPLVKRGVPIEPVQIESTSAPGFLDRYKLLLLTYEGQKPPRPEFHKALAKWVRDGGALVVVDDDGDPYNGVREWWNTPPNAYKTPRQHLFEAIGIPKDATGLHKAGRGVVIREALSPALLTYREDGAETIRKIVRQAAAAIKLSWKETGSLVLRRGPYLVAVGLDESVPDAKPRVLVGRYLNLFDPELAVLSNVTISPRSRMLLFDLNTVKPADFRVVAAACRVRDAKSDGKTLRFQADGIGDTNAVVRIAAPTGPVEVRIDGQPLDPSKYDYSGGLLRARFPNSAESLSIEVRLVK
jgi:hypothetical protein